jgi:hypothetical protein
MRSSTEDASLRREIASYLQLLEEEYQRRGLSVAEAPRQARLSLGGVERTRELRRQARSFAWIDTCGATSTPPLGSSPVMSNSDWPSCSLSGWELVEGRQWSA